MAGKAEATRERILAAAMAEFSAHGIAGARIERIAKSAGFNKNLIYVYFDNKETLFATVLQKHLTRVYDEIAFTPEDLPGYAAQVFDFAMAHPDLMRLMAWFTLEQPGDGPPERADSMTAKLDRIGQAQAAGRIGNAFPPAFLVIVIMTLATAWTAANPFGPALDPEAAKDPVGLRQRIAEAIRVLSSANAGAD